MRHTYKQVVEKQCYKDMLEGNERIHRGYRGWKEDP